MKRTTRYTFFILSILLLSIANDALAQGSNCSDPLIISNLPFVSNGLTTAGFGDDYSTSPCDDNYISGDDYVLTYTPVGNEYLTIRLSNVGAWTGLHFLDACPDVATTCVASDISSQPGNRLVENIFLNGGTTYYIVVSTFAAPQNTTFDISVRQGNPPPAGTDCSNPLVISTLPFEDLGQSTESFGDLYSGTGPCLVEDYLDGNEIIYRYTPEANEDVSLKISNISGFFTSVQFMDACVNDSPSCIAGAANQVTTNDLILEHLFLEKGQAYYIVISTWENPQSTAFDLKMIAERTCPDVENAVISDITEESARLTWSSAAPSWNVMLEDAGSSPTGTSTLVHTNSFDFVGLLPDHVYDVYVQANCPPASLMITGVYDGPLSGGNPKGVELFVVNDIDDLSEYSIGSANNGEGSDGAEYVFPAISVAKGTHLHWTSDSLLFESFFGFAPDFMNPNALINGNDAVELFFENQVIDAFGDINVDGTDQVWEYKDGWAYRRSGQINNNGFFDPTRWNYSGIDVLEGGPTNDVCDVPMTINNFTAPFELQSQWLGPISFSTRPAAPVCNGKFLDNGGASRPYSTTSNESYTICPDQTGYAVSVKFDLFDLQADGMLCIDELFIYDGEDTNASLITAPNGSGGGWCWDLQSTTAGGTGDLLNQTITSSNINGCLTFVFNADASGNNAGWEASVSCTPVENCQDPQDLAASEVTENSAKVSWRSLAPQSQTSMLVWGPTGIDPLQATPISITEGEYDITGLVSSTQYEFYVREDCQAFGESNWVGPVSFFTSCSSDQGDNMQNAIIVPNLPYIATGSTADCFSDDIGNSAADAFYSFVSEDCIQSIRISTCSELSDFDTYLMILDSLGNTIASNDDAPEDVCSEEVDGLRRLSALEISIRPNTKYYIVVEGFGPHEGIFELSIEEGDLQPMAAMAIAEEVSCFGASDGLLDIEVMGGVLPYTYNWNDGTSENNLDGLEAGAYTLTITDACGVEYSETFTVNGPEEIQIQQEVVNVSATGEQDGFISLEISGGVSPFQYLWSNGETTRNLANLASGEYCITITDASNCTIMDCYQVESGLVSVGEIELISKIAIQPNPTQDRAQIKLEFQKEVDLRVEFIDMTGRILHSFDREPASQKDYELDVSSYPDGIYFVQISYDNYVLSYKLVVAR